MAKATKARGASPSPKRGSAPKAIAGTGRDPTAGSGSAPVQNVTYTAQGLMGGMSDNSVRTDQFQTMVDAFNSKLRKVPREDPFKVEVGK